MIWRCFESGMMQKRLWDLGCEAEALNVSLSNVNALKSVAP